MARIHYVKAAQQRYKMVPTIAPATGEPQTIPVRRKDGSPKTTRTGKPIVRRLTHPDPTQPLPMPKCGKCGNEIEVGAPYKWVKTKSGPYGGTVKYRCSTCPVWRPSELSSSKMAEIMAAQEELDDQLPAAESVDDLESLRDNLAEAIRGVAEQYEESASNMEDGFGHETEQSMELRERAESLEAWADEVESVDFDDFDEDDIGEEDPDEDEIEAARDAHWEEQRSKLDDIAQECPV